MRILHPLLLTGFTFLAVSSLSQPKISAGLKAGLNLSSQSIDYSGADYSALPGFQAGAFGHVKFTHWAIQPEVVYSMQGTRIKTGDTSLDATFSYVNVPVVVKYFFVPRFAVAFGPQLGFLTCAKSDYHPVTKEPYPEQVYTRAYKKTDFGLSAGLTWEAYEGWQVDLRYTLGLTSINDFPDVAETKNNVMQVTVGYRLIKIK
jgi:hypothetical protein